MSEPIASPEPTAPRPGSTRTGPGRELIAVYAIFALSASARAGFQIATKFGDAPVAYTLSAFAAVVYILATVTLAVGTPTARRIAVVSCSVEFSACWRSAPGASPTRPPSPTRRCGLAMGAATASFRSSFPFSACYGYAAGPDGLEPGAGS